MPNQVLLRYLMYVTSILFIALFTYLILPVNTQKLGKADFSIISEEEINKNLELFDYERYSQIGKDKAREAIKRKLTSFGYKIKEQKFDNYLNIIVDGDQVEKDDHILIGAHYDSLKGKKGMDDNASGVAALLSMAEHFKDSNIKFIAFDGEEDALKGSKYYTENMNGEVPKMAISLEMLGTYKEETGSQKLPRLFNIFFSDVYKRAKANYFVGNFSTAVCSKELKDFCDKYEAQGSGNKLQVYTLQIPTSAYLKKIFTDLFRSDHTPFFEKGIPVVMLTDTANFRNENYHKETDTLDKVNTSFVSKQCNSLIGALQDLQ